MDQRLSIVSLGVEDVGRSTAFYQRLGWTPSPASNESITFFQLGGVALGLYGRDALAEDACVESDGRGFDGVTLAYNARTKRDVDATLALAEAAGARILKPAQDVFWGGYSGYFADLDGHAWEVAWNPAIQITDSGEIVLP